MPSEELKRLVNDVELRDIGPFELIAIRGSIEPDGHRAVIGPSGGRAQFSPDDYPDPSLQLQTFLGEEDMTLLIRLRAHFEAEVGDLSVGVQAEYKVSDDWRGRFGTGLQLEFAELVGVMAITPYLRHWCAELTRNVFDTPLLLGILRSGDLRFSRDGVQEEA